VSIINAPAVFRSLVDSQVEATRDGFLLRDRNAHSVTVSTAFWDEGQLLAVLEAVCATLRARGAEVTPKMKGAAKLQGFRPTEGLRIDPLPTPPVEAPKKAPKPAKASDVVVEAPAPLKVASKAPKGRSKRG
jgi:hypothetical protein